jgi:hypothetical protein
VGEHIDVPGARGGGLELLQRDEHGWHRRIDRLRFGRQRITDQAGRNRSVCLRQDGIAVRKAALIAPGPAAAHVPRGFTRLGHALPEIGRQSLAGLVDQLGQGPIVLACRTAKGRIESEVGHRRTSWSAESAARMFQPVRA